MDDTPDSTQALAQLVQRRHDCLRELLSLAQRQAALVESSDMDGLLVLLDHKQRHVDALLEASRALGRFQEDDPDRRAWPDLARHAATQQTWQECNAMYEEIVRLEQASEGVLRQRRDDVGRQLDTGRQAKEVHAAYLQGRQPLAAQSSVHFDLIEE